MKCKECIYKADIGNTKETGSAICTFPQNFFPISIDDECKYDNCESTLSYVVNLTDKIKLLLGDIVEKVIVMETPNIRCRESFTDPLVSEKDKSITVCPYMET